ncbi:MAG TPA: CoA-transferase [Thermoplasmata archaeon]|nr:CoA-transferase [Thermoplasmata archaeon]
MAERRSKVTEAVDAVRRLVPRDATVAVGGMHMHNAPMALVREAIRQGVRIGTLVTSPSASLQADLPIAAGLVREVVCSYIGFEHLGLAPAFRRAAESGAIQVREADEAYVVFALRAAAAGVPFLPLPEGVGDTDLPRLNPEDYRTATDPFTGKTVVCVRALRPDVAIVHCQKADAYGNGIFEGSVFTDLDMAKAAKAVVLQCEEVVPSEYVRGHAGRVRLPGFLVDAVVPVPFGCHPTSSHRYYRHDEAHLQEYLAAKGDAGAYLSKYVTGPGDHEAYLEAIGGRARVEALLEPRPPW